MKTIMQAIDEFHNVLGQPMPDKPQLPKLSVRKLRRKLLQEEYKEYKQAENNNDLENIAKELADIIYIVAGTAHAYGINLDAVFEKVHESNMEKFPNGKILRRADGKIQKPEGWTMPDISEAMSETIFK